MELPKIYDAMKAKASKEDVARDLYTRTTALVGYVILLLKMTI